MQKSISIITGILCAAIIVVSSCAPARIVEPLSKGEHVAGFDVGGPMVTISQVRTPIPLTSFTYGYGISGRAATWGSLHTTSLLFGLAHLEGGIQWQLTDPYKFTTWGVGASASGQLVHDFAYNITSGWPVLSINAYKYLDRGGLMYFASENWIDVFSEPVNSYVAVNNITPALQIGYLSEKTDYQWQFAFSYIAPFNRNDDLVVNYYNPISRYGALGIYAGINWYLP